MKALEQFPDHSSRGMICGAAAPVMRKALERGEPTYFNDDSHWNAAGNRVAAEALLATMKELNARLRQSPARPDRQGV